MQNKNQSVTSLLKFVHHGTSLWSVICALSCYNSLYKLCFVHVDQQRHYLFHDFDCNDITV